jgi:GAF domain-containing protein
VSAPGLDRDQLHSETLYAVIGVVASSPDLDRVLEGVVDLLTEATDCHACFVYLRDGDTLRLQAASRIYAHFVGRLEWGMDQGLTGWVARHNRPAFIRDQALEDPRNKYVPELEEEHFQSMVAVPVPARSGEVLGVVVLHTVAPREFDTGVLTFLSHTASLVAGAIENARLYADTRRRVEALTTLSALSQRIAAVTRREELFPVVTEGVRRLLGGALCQLYQLDAESGRLELAAADPPERSESWLGGDGAARLLDLLQRGGRDTAHGAGGERAGAVLAAPVQAGREPLGVLAVLRPEPFRDDEDELLRAVANQLAVALEKAALIERLTAENIVRDLFAALADGDEDVADARARAAGFELARSYVVIRGSPAAAPPVERSWPAVAARAEARLRRLAPGALFDAGRDGLLALAVAPLPGAEAPDLAAELARLGAEEGVAFGLSVPATGAAGGRRSVREAAEAARIAQALERGGGALAYEALGAYKYLVHLSLDDAPRDRHWTAVERLLDYDTRRNTELVDTLERYLQARRSVTTTARELYIHPNTLRQRLDRIEQLSGLALADEDLLALELAIKLVRLRAMGAPPAPP